MEPNDEEEYKDITQEYNEMKERERAIRDDERSKRFVKQNFSTALIITFITIAIISLAYLVSRPVFYGLGEYKDHFLFNIMYRLEKNFKGNFQILSPEVDVTADKTPDTVYQVKGKYDIVFKAQKTNETIHTDYDQYLYKHYVEEYIQQKKATDIVMNDSKTDWNGEDYYDFQFGIQIESYDQIEEIVHNRLYDLFNELYRRAQKDMNHYVIGYDAQIYLNDFSTTIQNYEVLFHDEAFCVNKIKMEYIQYLLDNGIVDETISEQEIFKYNIPTKMELDVNGKVPNRIYVSFDYATMDYFIDIGAIIGLLKNIDNYQTDFWGNIISITFQGKKYQLDDEAYLEIKGNRYSNLWTMKMLQDVLNVKVEYDYDNKIIHLHG